jgi:Pyridoxamine 5'-phosphate oxidase
VTNPLSSTERTTHRRLREQGRTDRGDLFAVLAAGLVAHLGVVNDGWPMVVPTSYGFDDTTYLHGSVASVSLGADSAVCVTITVADGQAESAESGHLQSQGTRQVQGQDPGCEGCHGGTQARDQCDAADDGRAGCGSGWDLG